MSPSKLDPHQRARDFRYDPNQSKQRRHEGGKLHLHHVYKDLTTVTYLQNRPAEDTRYIILDELPDMTEDWIEKMVVVRSPVGGEPDRMYLGIQNSDDSLSWIEISIMASAPPTVGEGGGGGVAGAPTFTWSAHYGVGSGLKTNLASIYASLDSDSTGNIWVGSMGESKLRKFSLTGVALLAINLPTPIATSAYVCAVACAADDSVWAGDIRQERVFHYSSAGVAQTSWLPTGIDDPAGLAFNPAGTLIYLTDKGVTNNWLKAYNFPALTLNATLATGFTGVGGVDTDSAGNIYVADRGSHCIRKYSSAGALLSTWGTPGVQQTDNSGFSQPVGVHVDASDRIYIADRYNHRVQVYDTSGRFLTGFGGFGTGSGFFQYPSDVSTFGTTVYVMDSYNNRISVWTIS